MLSSRARIERRRGASGTSRDEYLQSLVDEFQASKQVEARRQVVAHLGNFAYDPINYRAFDALHVVDLFLDAADDEDPVIRRLGTQALSNCAADPIFARSLAAEEEERKALSRGLASADIETVVAAAIALYCLARAGHADAILHPDTLAALRSFAVAQPAHPPAAAIGERDAARMQLRHVAALALEAIETASTTR